MFEGKYLTAEGELVELTWKTPFNHNTNAESERVGLTCNDPSKAQQSQEEEANINTIVGRFLKTGLLPQAKLPPTLDAFADIFDFQSAMNILAEARHSFMQLDPQVRNAFNNDPHLFVSQIDLMTNDPDQDRRAKNFEALRAMGLAVEAGPVADQTTLGDVLAAIKEQATKGGSPAPEVTKGAP